jgi:hypothetical protein
MTPSTIKQRMHRDDGYSDFVLLLVRGSASANSAAISSCWVYAMDAVAGKTKIDRHWQDSNLRGIDPVDF